VVLSSTSEYAESDKESPDMKKIKKVFDFFDGSISDWYAQFNTDLHYGMTAHTNKQIKMSTRCASCLVIVGSTTGICLSPSTERR
jgi:hypothetical protein